MHIKHCVAYKMAKLLLHCWQCQCISLNDVVKQAQPET